MARLQKFRKSDIIATLEELELNILPMNRVTYHIDKIKAFPDFDEESKIV